jgi:hypothetical protein
MHHTRGFFHFQYLKTLLTGMLLVAKKLLRGLTKGESELLSPSFDPLNPAGVAAFHSNQLCSLYGVN